MDDEIQLLEALYPSITVVRSGKVVSLSYEHKARIGAVRITVTIEDSDAYPRLSRPRTIINRGLSAEAEREVRKKVDLSCKELENDFCLVQTFSSCIAELDEFAPSCGICFDYIDDSDIYVCQPCSHLFHKDSCFKSWVAQCEVNSASRPDTETAKVRRKQIESNAEADLKMVRLKLENLETDRIRLTGRKEAITARLTEISKSQPQSTSVNNRRSSDKNVAAERDKDDVDVTDVQELQRRLTQVNSSFKSNSIALAGVRKDEANAELSLKNVRTTLENAFIEERTAQKRKIPCPVCRTAVNALDLSD